MTAPFADAPLECSALQWTIKTSFVRYVLHMAQGECRVTGGARADEASGFHMPLRSGGVSRQGDEWLLSFDGRLHFFAHGGAMDFVLSDVELYLAPGGGSLSVAGRDDARLVIAALQAPPPTRGDGAHRWTNVLPLLTPEGVELFGGVYQVGERLDEIRLIIRDADLRPEPGPSSEE